MKSLSIWCRGASYLTDILSDLWILTEKSPRGALPETNNVSGLMENLFIFGVGAHPDPQISCRIYGYLARSRLGAPSPTQNWCRISSKACLFGVGVHPNPHILSDLWIFSEKSPRGALFTQILCRISWKTCLRGVGAHPTHRYAVGSMDI
jgi:hypothetical protein